MALMTAEVLQEYLGNDLEQWCDWGHLTEEAFNSLSRKYVAMDLVKTTLPIQSEVQTLRQQVADLTTKNQELQEELDLLKMAAANPNYGSF